MTVTQILDIVLPIPAGCCSQQRWELQRKAFTEWINAHRDLGDNEIIYKLKKML